MIASAISDTRVGISNRRRLNPNVHLESFQLDIYSSDGNSEESYEDDDDLQALNDALVVEKNFKISKFLENKRLKQLEEKQMIL